MVNLDHAFKENNIAVDACSWQNGCFLAMWRLALVQTDSFYSVFYKWLSTLLNPILLGM